MLISSSILHALSPYTVLNTLPNTSNRGGDVRQLNLLTMTVEGDFRYGA